MAVVLLQIKWGWASIACPSEDVNTKYFRKDVTLFKNQKDNPSLARCKTLVLLSFCNEKKIMTYNYSFSVALTQLHD
jgi:hypothetical protein